MAVNGSGAFLGTLNMLSGNAARTAPDSEQARRVVLQRLQAGPADKAALAELSLPMSAVERAVHELTTLGLVDPPGADGAVRLSDYAGKALTYLAPF
jgi:hypothetical protein